MRTVVALGGNALCDGAEPTVAEQRDRISATVERLETVRERGHDLVLTHGNGPQVGQLLRQQDADDGPARPLDVLGAETQGQLGYLLQQALDEQFPGRAATVLTRVRVDPDDPAFERPTKPVGPEYTDAEAAERSFETTEVTTAAGETAYRRVVPSPEPEAVLESEHVESLVEGGATVVCGGGGGVPVVADDGESNDSGDQAGELSGVEAVVDKDHTSQLVASEVDADLLVLATDVACAYIDLGTPDQDPIEDVDSETMRAHLERGEFAEGSMQPKVEAALAFLDSGGERAVICAIEDVAAGVAGEAGTQIQS
jgi:carbamate kinase